jgi:hypothetical protein
MTFENKGKPGYSASQSRRKYVVKCCGRKSCFNVSAKRKPNATRTKSAKVTEKISTLASNISPTKTLQKEANSGSDPDKAEEELDSTQATQLVTGNNSPSEALNGDASQEAQDPKSASGDMTTTPSQAEVTVGTSADGVAAPSKSDSAPPPLADASETTPSGASTPMTSASSSQLLESTAPAATSSVASTLKSANSNQNTDAVHDPTNNALSSTTITTTTSAPVQSATSTTTTTSSTVKTSNPLLTKGATATTKKASIIPECPASCKKDVLNKFIYI